MKIAALFFFGLLSLACSSQPVDNPRIKTFLDKFQKYVEEIKKVEAENPENKVAKCRIIADNAMTQINHIKKKDPNYDVKPLEDQVKPYIEAHKTGVQQHNDRAAAAGKHSDKSGDGCAAIFMANTTVEIRAMADVKEDVKKHIEQIRLYNEKVNRLLAGNTAGVEVCSDYLQGTIASEKKAIQNFLKEAQEKYEPQVQYAYRELIGRQAYWDAARRIYPAMQGAGEVYKTVSDALLLLGSMDDAVAKAKERKQERLKNSFMPKAVVVNPVLEAEFKEAFGNEGWGETIVRIHILTKEWSIVRNQLTGIILYRTQSAAIVAKQKPGNCILYNYTIQQQYTGSSYSQVSARLSHGVIEAEFLCENAK